MQLQDDDPLKRMKQEILDKYDMPHEATYPIRRNGWPATMLPFIAFVQLTPEQCAVGSSGRWTSCGRELNKLAEGLLQQGTLPVTNAVNTGDIARAWLSVEVASRTAALESTKTEDESLAARLASDTSALASQRQPEGRHSCGAGSERYLEAAVASVRLEEGRILQRTRRELQQARK